MFHREGYKIILNTFLITVTLSICVEYAIENLWIQKLLQLSGIIILLLILQFFRNPKRKTIINKNHIISPVDGKVVNIKEVFEKEQNPLKLFPFELHGHYNIDAIKRLLKQFINLLKIKSYFTNIALSFSRGRVPLSKLLSTYTY